MIVVVIITLSGLGCASSPQRNILPVVTTAPRVEVVPAPLLNNEQYLIGSTNETNNAEESGQQSLFGGFKEDENETVIVQSVQPQLVEKQFAAAPLPSATPRQSHVHTLYPVSGKIWTHECSTCGSNVGMSTPMVYQSPPPPQAYSQSSPQTCQQLPQSVFQYPQNIYPGSGTKMLDRGTVRNEKRTRTSERKVIAEQLPNGMSRTDIRVDETIVKGGYWTETGPVGLR